VDFLCDRLLTTKIDSGADNGLSENARAASSLRETQYAPVKGKAKETEERIRVALGRLSGDALMQRKNQEKRGIKISSESRASVSRYARVK